MSDVPDGFDDDEKLLWRRWASFEHTPQKTVLDLLRIIARERSRAVLAENDLIKVSSDYDHLEDSVGRSRLSDVDTSVVREAVLYASTFYGALAGDLPEKAAKRKVLDEIVRRIDAGETVALLMRATKDGE